jgi:tetratricopeptide (TPR) repeat protein
MSLRTQNHKLRALQARAAENEQKARRSEQKAHLESARLKAGVERIYAWQKHVVKNLPDELHKDPLLRIFPRTSIKRFIVIAIRTSIENYEEIVAEFPDLTGLRSGMAALYHDQGQVQREIQQTDEAIHNLGLAVDHQLKAFRQEPDVLQYRRELSVYYGDLARAQREAGRHSDAVATTLDRARLWPDNPGELYEAARELAACVPADDFAPQAMTVLKQAVSRGYRDLDALKSDEALDPLRGRDDFRALLAALDQRRRTSSTLKVARERSRSSRPARP